jgi:hypothetical protein
VGWNKIVEDAAGYWQERALEAENKLKLEREKLNEENRNLLSENIDLLVILHKKRGLLTKIEELERNLRQQQDISMYWMERSDDFERRLNDILRSDFGWGR